MCVHACARASGSGASAFLVLLPLATTISTNGAEAADALTDRKTGRMSGTCVCVHVCTSVYVRAFVCVCVCASVVV